MTQSTSSSSRAASSRPAKEHHATKAKRERVQAILGRFEKKGLDPKTGMAEELVALGRRARRVQDGNSDPEVIKLVEAILRITRPANELDYMAEQLKWLDSLMKTA